MVNRIIEQDAKAFVKILEAHEGSRRTAEKFENFVTLAYCAYAKTMAPDRETADKLEERYMRIANSYRDKDAIRAMPEALALVHRHASEYFDFLGHVAGVMGVLGKELGQFFTPMEVSQLLARMTAGEGPEPAIEHDGYLSMSEPTVGAGGMVLAMAEALKLKGYDPSTQMLVQARDVSGLAYEMCYIQLTFARVPALVIHGNTLTLERFRHAFTPACLAFYQRQGHLDIGFRSHRSDPGHPCYIYPPLAMPRRQTHSASPPPVEQDVELQSGPESPPPRPAPIHFEPETEEKRDEPEQLSLF